MSKANKTPKVIRHGDVDLVSVSKIPKEAKLVTSSKDFHKDGFVLAYGEVTGHRHLLKTGKQQIESTDPAIREMFVEGKVKVYETEKGVRYVQVLAPTPLVHEDHRTLVIPEGIYEQKQEVEEDPFSEAAAAERVRQVID